ncbi:hypothetical protein BKA70DRAFT_1099300, partial [Coprinopsis sp. MPI-PUGE-AT-0042]
GSYILSELDRSISKLRFAAYQLIPYHPRDVRQIPVTKITQMSEKELDDFTFDREQDEEDI